MLGDDATGDPNITTDSSGMSVVTVTGSTDSEGSLLTLVLFGAALLWLYSDSGKHA